MWVAQGTGGDSRRQVRMSFPFRPVHRLTDRRKKETKDEKKPLVRKPGLNETTSLEDTRVECGSLISSRVCDLPLKHSISKLLPRSSESICGVPRERERERERAHAGVFSCCAQE